MRKKLNPKKVRQYEAFIEALILNSGGSGLMFPKFENTPEHHDLLNMFKSGKFGIKHPFFFSSTEFALEYAFDEFNEVFELIEKNEDWYEKTKVVDGWNLFIRAQDEPWANLVFSVWVDSTFAPFVSKLNRDEFIQFTDQDVELIHDQTRSIVFDFKYMGIMKKDDPLYSGSSENINFSDLETKGKMMFHYGIWIASADRYDEFSNQKNLKKRQSLISVKVPWDGSSNYIVYTAKDADGILRYVGEGKAGRQLHVNSGASHSCKINEHFFKRGAMEVEIVRESLTKPKALAVEKFLIAKHRNTLWNIKDNPDARIYNK